MSCGRGPTAVLGRSYSMPTTDSKQRPVIARSQSDAAAPITWTVWSLWFAQSQCVAQASARKHAGHAGSCGRRETQTLEDPTDVHINGKVSASLTRM